VSLVEAGGLDTGIRRDLHHLSAPAAVGAWPMAGGIPVGQRVPLERTRSNGR
jgi:hypothetical protein